MTISFSGLATGIDTNALVEQLVALERAPANKLAARKSDANRRMAIVSDFISKLTALKTARKALDTTSEINAITASSSDEARVKVTSSGAAQPAQLNLRVGALARGQTSVSSLFDSADQLVPGAGMLGIKVGEGEEVQVEFTSLDTLASLAQRINDEVDGVNAQVINTSDGVQIAVTSEETGADHSFTFSEAGTSLGFLAPDSLKTTAQDASFTLNGIAMTRSSNTVADAITGLTFELRGTHAVTDPDTLVSVARDPAGAETNIKSLVDAFNSVADAINAQTAFSGVTRGEDTLFGDSTVRALQRQMASMASAQYPHGEGTVTLRQIGIQFDRSGKLTLDSAAFAKALAADPGAIEELLTGADGLGTAIDKLTDQYTRAGDGILTAKKTSISDQMSRFDDQIDRIETRASEVGDMLHAQFTKLEALISSLKSQQSALSAMFG
jgi:flagellar hook-associated protein 2